MEKLLGFLKGLFSSNKKVLDVIQKVEMVEKQVESVLPEVKKEDKPKKVLKKTKKVDVEQKVKKTKKVDVELKVKNAKKPKK